MIKLLYSLILATSFMAISIAQTDSLITISADLQLLRLNENTWQHISYAEFQSSRFSSNGLVYINDSQAVLVDTPADDSLTKLLIEYFTKQGISFVAVVPTHWHSDCLGGLKAAHGLGIPSYGNQLTCELAIKAEYEAPQLSFSDSLIIKIGNEQIECRFLGGGHAVDNIVVYIPSNKILFGGCMVKSMRNNGLGYTADADLTAWPETLAKLKVRYPDAKMVIPGHGNAGSLELLDHTIDLLSEM